MSDPTIDPEDKSTVTQTSEEAPIRDNKGRFVPGNKAHSTYVIERKKDKAAPILAAITEEFAPEEIRVLLRRGVKMAQMADDNGKVLLEYIRFIAAYAIGKPITRAIGAQVSTEDFLNWFKPRESDDDHADIELEANDVEGS